MKQWSFAVLRLGMLCCGLFTGAAFSADSAIALVPLPLKVEPKEGVFALNKDVAILVQNGSTDAANVGRQLADRINRSTGFNLVASPSDAAGPVKNAILLTAQGADAALGKEGYRLEVSPGGVVIAASAGPGLFYGMQTLLQLLPPEIYSASKAESAVAWTAPAVRIEDKPRFVWRGLMLDVSRHFFNKEEVKNFIDLLAQHKMNTFHWHLVDDQGWRIEIKKYPKLTEIGAWRTGIGFGLDPKATTAYGPDGRYGGFFTQDDVREVVAYAKDRYVAVVPEIEMPGHSVAALAAYPELSCFGGQMEPTGKVTPFSTDFPAAIHRGIYCAGNDAAFEFLEDVLGEVIELFPCKYFHVGGDEVKKDTWKRCEKCQARIQKEGLADEKELQSYFIRRIEKYLNAHGRVLIGWDEILEGGLAPNATVMSWRGVKGGIAAANAGHDVVMPPTTHCYLDYRQAPTGEPLAIGGDKPSPGRILPLQKVYAFEPIPEEIPADKAHHVLGVDGNLWSEFFPNYAHVQYMAYPRACAIAETNWTEAGRKDWDDFLARLETHLLRLKAQGANYRPLQTP